MREGEARSDTFDVFVRPLNSVAALNADSFERVAVSPATDLLRIVVRGHEGPDAPAGALVTATSRGVHVLDALPPHLLDTAATSPDARWRLAFRLPANLVAEDAMFTLRVGGELVCLPAPTRINPAEASGERAPEPLRDPDPAVLLATLSGALAQSERARQEAEIERDVAWGELQRPLPVPEPGPVAAPAPERQRLSRITRDGALVGIVSLVVAAAGLVQEAGVSSSGPTDDRLERLRLPAGSGPKAVAGAGRAVHDIPSRYLDLYRRAARRYDLSWPILAAVGKIEADHGRLHPQVSSAGAVGPAQFLPGTWQRFGMDADGDGRISSGSAADSIFAMAGYLRASGAPQDWRRALWVYNHSTEYVEDVLKLARRYGADSPR